MFDQPATRLHQPLLHTGERSVVDPLRSREPPPPVAQLVSNHAQPRPPLVGPKSMAAQPVHLHCLLAFLEPLLCRPSLVLESHHGLAVCLQVGHDVSHARK
jgi:hypothetical protein